MSWPSSCVRCFCSAVLNHVAQVESSADGLKITNTGTQSDGDPVLISVVSTTGTEITVSTPGKAKIFDYIGSGVSFKCYGADVMVPPFGDAVCDGS